MIFRIYFDMFETLNIYSKTRKQSNVCCFAYVIIAVNSGGIRLKKAPAKPV